MAIAFNGITPNARASSALLGLGSSQKPLPFSICFSQPHNHRPKYRVIAHSAANSSAVKTQTTSSDFESHQLPEIQENPTSTSTSCKLCSKTSKIGVLFIVLFDLFVSYSLYVLEYKPMVIKT